MKRIGLPIQHNPGRDCLPALLLGVAISLLACGDDPHSNPASAGPAGVAAEVFGPREVFIRLDAGRPDDAAAWLDRSGQIDSVADDSGDGNVDAGPALSDVSDVKDDGPGSDWGEPIEAPPREWTWIPFSDTRCADGSPTGLGVNLNPGADKVFIYLQGGGACWDYTTCSGAVTTALHLDGFDEDDFGGLIAAVFLNAPLYRRDAEKNPLAEAHYVFIPYCTGDIFSGDRVAELEGLFPWESNRIHFNGHNNIEAYLRRLVPTFQDVDRVILSGSSAGGFGAGLNWPLVQEAFGEVRVDLLDDSGPPVEPSEGLWAEWRDTWGMWLPEDCSDCHLGVERIVDYLRETSLQMGRMGLLSYTRDSVVSGFMRILPRVFEERLLELADDFDEESNAQYFFVRGPLHTMLVAGVELVEASDGTPLWQWVAEMAEDDPGWSSHRP